MPAKKSIVETDGLNPQHTGVVNAWGGAILRGEPLVADGREGIRGLMLSNAMHLSAFLGREVEMPIDEDLFYEESDPSRHVIADLSNTYGGTR